MEENNFNWKGRLGPLALKISDLTFTPSTISTLLASELNIRAGESVIDVGCGTGILAIVAAKLGATNVIAVDKSPDVVDVGNYNARAHGVADHIEFYSGDLFSPLPDDIRADVIIGDVSGIPDTLADDSGWFPSRKGGGPNGCELPIRMLQDARRYLAERGRIYLPTGTLQDEASILDAARSLYKKVQQLKERRIPLPPQLAESKVLTDLVDAGVVSIERRGSRFFWEARVWEISAPV